MNPAADLAVTCPRCRNRGKWFGAKWGPFCSERCKLIDLGTWFNEEQRISRELRPGDWRGFEDLPPGMHPDRLE